MNLNILTELPDGFFESKAHEVGKIFDGPTLVHLRGNNPCTVFISCLLHGNETSGFYAIQEYLKDKSEYKKDMILFFGNIEAATAGLRHLPDQLDYNRIWENHPSPEGELAQKIFEYAKSNGIRAAVDLHNNTGKNPFYACINHLDEDFFKLAQLFGDKIVYFEKPSEVLSNKFGDLCPTIVIECGRPDNPKSVPYLVNFLENFIEKFSFEGFVLTDEIRYYQTFGRIKLAPEMRVCFQSDKISNSQLTLRDDLDTLNFTEVHNGQSLGTGSEEVLREELIVLDDEDNDITNEIFLWKKNGAVVFKKDVVPAMLTKNLTIAKEDSLGYLMTIKTIRL